MRALLVSSRALVMIALLAVVVSAQAIAQVGPPGGTIYAHDQAYRVVATPRDLPAHGMFDTIYVLGEGLAAVSDAAPGDREYNGGRWEVRMVTFVSIPPTQFTNAEDIEAAAAQGEVTIGEIARRFECPLIKGNPR